MEEGLDPSTRRRLAVPAVLFALYVLHLVFFRTDAFLTRWIDGCFAFFLALVLAFLILRSAPAAGSADAREDDQRRDGGTGGTP